ncbi:MAG: hypothetical protein AAGF15_00045 [Pseudomonadota bacterium]
MERAGHLHDITIERIGARGDGIGTVDGKPAYVPFTAPGDQIRAKVAAAGQGTVVEILSASPGRISPLCSHFGRCGGCALQHISEPIYAEWLRTRIADALSPKGFARDDLLGSIISDPIISPPASRRRATMHLVAAGGGRAHIGFHRRASHVVEPLSECAVLLPEIFAVAKHIAREAVALAPAQIMLTRVEEGIDVVASGFRDITPDIQFVLAELLQAPMVVRMTARAKNGDELSLSESPPHVRFRGMAVPFPAGAFLQATKAGEIAMQDAVSKAVSPDAVIADLFSGLGTFSLPLARTRKGRGHVTAVEGARDLIDAQLQISRIQRLRLKTEHRDLFRKPLSPPELEPFDTVIFDPPRAGADAQSRALATSRVPQVIALSCNPNTFARDARTLVNGGYKLTAITPVGQFLWSHHVELVAEFEKAQP